MKVIAKPVLRTYEVLLTEEDLRSSVGPIIKSSDTLQVTHVDHAPIDDGHMVRICIVAVPAA